MGIIGDFLTRSSFSEHLQKWLVGDDDGGVMTAAGAAVTEDSAMALTSVYACVKLIAWTTASLPLAVYKYLQPRGKELATEHPLFDLLHATPNPEQTSFQWRSLTSVHQNLWGAGISEIEFNGAGDPVALWPLPPWKVTPKRMANGTIVYELKLDGGGIRVLQSWQVVVFPALSTSSYDWLSPIGLHRETIGAALAVKDFGARTFGQGTNPAGVVYHPGKLSENSQKTLKESFKGYQGLGNAHRLMLLDEGMKWERVGLPPQDAQYLETRRFDISEVARIYNIPLYMLQDHEKQTSWGAGIEEQKDGFVTFTLLPYLVQWEQELNRRLIYDDLHFVKFNVNGLMRGKITDRFAAYQIGRNGGWLSANDIRELEDQNPLPGEQGDIYLVPLNFQNAKFAGEKPQPAPAPAAAPAAPTKEPNNAPAK
jgi:HK97 family phage portal protein